MCPLVIFSTTCQLEDGHSLATENSAASFVFMLNWHVCLTAIISLHLCSPFQSQSFSLCSPRRLIYGQSVHTQASYTKDTHTGQLLVCTGAWQMTKVKQHICRHRHYWKDTQTATEVIAVTSNWSRLNSRSICVRHYSSDTRPGTESASVCANEWVPFRHC